ncbi:hypothetical protein H9P43_002043 [Blastocladiella emersonii ATCC 22665]|nr:hypothetical protein H9P43_002043 [Blastocladiella emersonii ATCC 22665]
MVLLLGDKVGPAPGEYLCAGTGNTAVHTLPAAHFFRPEVFPGIAYHRARLRSGVAPKLHRFNRGSKRCHLEANRFFARYEELFGTRELALLLESPQTTALVYRAVSDRRKYLRSPDYVTDLRIREALATYYRPKKGGAVHHPHGAEVYYHELGAELRAAIIEAAERNLDSFLETLANELTDDFVAQRDYGYAPGNVQSRYALSATLYARRAAEHTAFDELFQHFCGVVDADLKHLLDDPADMDFHLRLFAIFPKLVALYIERNVISPDTTIPSLARSAESVKPVVRFSFEAFCSLFVVGQPSVRALPPAANAPVESIDALIGTDIAPPAAIESISPQDVERVETWLRNGVARGLASWDAMLSVMYHFVKPEHLWKDQAIIVNGRLETRKLRWFAGYITSINRMTVRIESYHGGVRPCSGVSDLSPFELRARINEWYAYRAGPLAHQFGAMSLHASGSVPRDVYEHATATIDDAYAYSYGGDDDYGLGHDDSDDSDEASDDEDPRAAAPARATKGQNGYRAAPVMQPKREAGKDVTNTVLPPAAKVDGRAAEIRGSGPALPPDPPAHQIPWLD